MREFAMVYLPENEVTPLSNADAIELAAHYGKAIPASKASISLCPGYSLYRH